MRRYLSYGRSFYDYSGVLVKFANTLCEEKKCGAVGPVSNGFSNHQSIRDVKNFETALSYANLHKGRNSKKVIGLSSGAVLFSEEALEQIGPFDEDLASPAYVIRDYCFRIMQNDWVLKICESAFLWDISNDGYSVYPNAAEEKLLEKKWGMHYFNSMYNENLITMIKEDAGAEIEVLEIGCDCGATLLEIKNRYPKSRIYGSELNKKAAEVASHFATVWINNIEEQNLECSSRFDYIIFGDVLEHLKDPLKTISYCKSFLKEKGCIIASIPNLMHISVINNLLEGNFTYTETGLLDKTHIHFFTFNEIIRMFQSGGYEIEKINTIIFPIEAEQSELIDKLINIKADTPRFMYEAFQYVLCARKI